jgi:DNA mismatch endonuclease (patch repair protein)
VFTRAKVAVYVDGCFWHGCPVHGTWPKANGDWWRAKIEANRERDRDTDRRLTAAAWRVIRVWEHEDVASAVARVEAAL